MLLAAVSVSITIAARESSSRNSVAPPRTALTRSYLGFDRNLYPGGAAFPALRKTFAFTGYWLNLPPGEKTNTWIGKRDFLRKSGFGFLVLFRGRDSHEFKKDSDGPAKGLLDAEATVAAAKKEGFPAGTIVFLDIEEGGRLSATYHAYLHAWLDALARSGYRAGVYCSGMPVKESGGVTILTADDIRANAGSREFIFFVFNDACPPSPGCVFPSAAPSVASSGVAYAQAWQYAQSPRRKEFTARCPAGYHPNGNCYSPNDASYEWDLDADTAASADPSNGARP
jgi:glycoside hydrolase-like protein